VNESIGNQAMVGFGGRSLCDCTAGCERCGWDGINLSWYLLASESSSQGLGAEQIKTAVQEILQEHGHLQLNLASPAAVSQLAGEIARKISDLSG